MNEKAKVIKLLIMFLVTALTVITITFAWFTAMNRTEPVIIESGTLRVYASLYYGEDNDEDGIITDDEYELLEDGINITDVIPGKEFFFKLNVKNNGSVPGHLTISVVNIIFSKPLMKETLRINFLDPLTNNETTRMIDTTEILIFEKYTLTNNTEYNFYFKIIGSEDISSDMYSEYVKLSSFLVRLDQIQE